MRISQLVMLGVGLLTAAANAGDGQDSDINFITIGDPGNVPYPGGPSREYAGRGSVDYAYRIAETELTSAQYIDYLNLFSLQSYELWTILIPGVSGYDFNIKGTPYRFYTQLTHPERAVVRITWAQAAMFVNWLHNGQTDDPESLMNGVYDISTLQYNGDGTYSGQVTRSPGARYWIPSLDEHLKAGYYDPDKNGNGPGWWVYGNSADVPPIYGVPGVGQVARELTSEQVVDLAGPRGTVATLPLGLYPEEQSPWGLLDLLGGSREWLEDWGEGQQGRLIRNAGDSTVILFEDFDQAWYYRDQWPTFQHGFRIASAAFEPADLNEDWNVNFFDVAVFIERYISNDLSVDFDSDGNLDADDVLLFLELLSQI